MSSLNSVLRTPANLSMTPDFQDALQRMEHTSDALFITGRAGTGKSTLLHLFRQQTRKNIAVLAPTGLAAINIGGQTIHSFFLFPPKLITPDQVRKNHRQMKVIQALDTLVIDEISMVRADVLQGIDISLKMHRQNNEPFGGVQMIFFGDVFQLPPVVGNDVRTYFDQHFGGAYFFHAPAYQEIAPQRIELQQVFRQSDAHFLNLLNALRDQSFTPQDLQLLNQRVNATVESDSKHPAIVLTSRTQTAESINLEHLATIKSKEYAFDAAVEGQFTADTVPADAHLRLKKGAQVMLLNNDSGKRWVNGTLATIAHLDEDEIWVKVDEDVYPLQPVAWEKFAYAFDTTENKIKEAVQGSFTQYPLKLAWAMTIHKAQGKTFDRVTIDMGSGAFAHGQTYVALSRCRTLEGISLRQPIRSRDIMLDPQVVAFYKAA
ncbi:MAG TPA: DEAD/DEAH box helicase [Alphaproteobacteria bacterium]